jgi:ribokinase
MQEENMQPKIVVVGSSNTDMVVKLPRLPNKGESIIGGEFMMPAGGKGANQAVAAARLGARVTLVARLGSDVFGDAALAGFKTEGIVTDHIARDAAAPSGVALIFVDANGDNMLAVAPGANGRLSPADVDSAEDVIAAADAVVLQLEIPLDTVQHALALARKHKVRTVLNPAPARPLRAELLSLVDVLVPNEHETMLLSGDVDQTVEQSAIHLRQMGVGTVVVTLGAQGAIIVGADQYGRKAPGFSVRAVDTTAAGDAFTAALAYAMARGDAVSDAVRFANAVGALTVTRMGAQPSLPTAAEVQAFMTGRR